MNRLEAIWDVSDPESALIREVYARYGLAMYMAQVLEHAIVNALLVLRFLPTRPVHNSKESWESAFDDFYVGEFGKTFGNMLKTLDSLCILPPEIILKLRAAKSTRDMLAHSFFRDHDLQFITQSGRVAMIDVCEAAIAEFKAADDELDAFCAPFRLRFGMTDEWIDQKFRELEAQAHEAHNSITSTERTPRDS
ncbi:hypothetical protein [Sphingomonas sp. CCH10-B3]|uniref:hypothetical protein n=1 Tax=Sphingomonas sp. CCH10-B3 TaxID=1768757 RepID=UPI000A428478|nr:hypothetical protein [Sphingomonas sp. CCH10-B3]